jgi:hypothetical protein
LTYFQQVTVHVLAIALKLKYGCLTSPTLMFSILGHPGFFTVRSPSRKVPVGLAKIHKLYPPHRINQIPYACLRVGRTATGLFRPGRNQNADANAGKVNNRNPFLNKLRTA